MVTEEVAKKKRAWYDKTKSKNLKRSLDWARNNKERRNTSNRKSTLKNFNKQKARDLSVKIKIPKGQVCEMCFFKSAKQKHHPDYNFPFKITFLCMDCHIKADKILGFRNGKKT